MHRPPSPVITNTTLHTPAPTHNLTLIRTAAELIELDVKLRSTHPGLKIPSLPIDPAGLPLARGFMRVRLDEVRQKMDAEEQARDVFRWNGQIPVSEVLYSIHLAEIVLADACMYGLIDTGG
ncbi:hypothetical protein JR316_0010153 [Psilocybe cubensis]|uniref:Uncharacterized protein n=1 Tax=Psilocybe cubensis TaxID=181762 RepID=A0ACB8GQH9_PSICU|nr:hypothetical protein JR316_0010153 [Psilocybe cubensis]KAH9477921.1 hypothetical protein JR316_0010153 [Psilocybe cubensis]